MNWRSSVVTKSLGFIVVPSEYLMPLRMVKVYVLPPSVGWGTSVARSGTICVPSEPPTRLNWTSPSWVLIRSAHSSSV